MRRAATPTREIREAPAIVHDVLRSSGEPLKAEARGFFESRFGHDFSRVRVHDGSHAAAAAESVNAMAFTVGKHIVFGAGRYAPNSDDGRRLIAHELSHVLQQGFEANSGSTPLPVIPSSHPLEHQAEQTARQALSSGVLDTLQPAAAGIARQGVPPDAGVPDAESVPDAGTPPGDAGTAPGASPAQGDTQASSPTVTPAPAPVQLPPVHCAPGNANPCPTAPAKTVLPNTCQQPAPKPGQVPPAAERKPDLPVIPPGDFGGDQVVADFVTKLACCQAQFNADDVIADKYKDDISAARSQADIQAKIDEDKAVRDAVDKVKSENPNLSSERLKKEIDKATKTAKAEAKKGAHARKDAALAAVTKENHDVMVQKLAQGYRDGWVNDYRQSMEAAINEYWIDGPRWQHQMEVYIANKKKEELARLTAKPGSKPKPKSKSKGVSKPEPQPETQPVLSADEINERVEAVLVQARCDRQVWSANLLEKFKRGWMVGRREEVDFNTIGKKEPMRRFFLGKDFHAPDVAEWFRVPIPADLGSGSAPIAPELLSLLIRLRILQPNFRAENRPAHGSWGFKGKGFSVDLYLTKENDTRDDRGFFPHDPAVSFLLAIDKAKSEGAEWLVLYNDFRVAQAVNNELKVRRVTFIGQTDSGTLTWHGPDPLKLHFHLDYMPKMDAPDPIAEKIRDKVLADHVVEMVKDIKNILEAPQPAAKGTKDTKKK